MEFELLCYAAMTIAIILLRHEPLTPATVIELPIELPVELPVELPITVIELVKSVQYKRPAAKGFATASCVVVVDTIAPVGWDLDKHGNPLRGTALKGRKRKLGIE